MNNIEKENNKILELENIIKYINNKLIINDINFCINSGDIYGVIGSNGSGKSTIAKIICNLLKNYFGDIRIFKNNIKSLKNIFFKKIGVVTQEYNFYPFESVYNTLFYQLGYYGIKKKSELIENCLNKLKINDLKYEKIYKLSGGNKRKILIAKSIVHNPELIILDEPFVGLDIEFKKYIINLLKKINKENNITIILVTHNINEINNLCKNIILVKEGKVTIIKNYIENIKKKIKLFYIYTSNINNNIVNILKKYKNIKIIKKNILYIKLKLNFNLNKILYLLIKNNIKIYNVKNINYNLEKYIIKKLENNE